MYPIYSYLELHDFAVGFIQVSLTCIALVRLNSKIFLTVTDSRVYKIIFFSVNIWNGTVYLTIWLQHSLNLDDILKWND